MGPLTLGLVLDHFAKEADNVIQKAITNMKEAAITVEEVAARKALEVIEAIKNAYQDSLDDTMDKISQTGTTLVSEVETALNSIQKHNFKELEKLEARFETLVLRLPFIDKQPRLTSMTPRYIAYHKDKDVVRLRFEGLFPFAKRADLRPMLTLSLGDRTFTPLAADQNLETGLGFHIPFLTDLPKDLESWNKKIALRGELKIPWEDGERRKEDSYNFWLGVLPISPGTFSVEYAKTIVDRKFQHFNSEAFHAEGDWPKSWVTKSSTVLLDPSWTLRPNSVVFNSYSIDYKGVRSPHGKWDKSIIEEPHKITCNVKCAGWEGHVRAIVDYTLSYQGYSDIEKTEFKSVTIRPLKWGEMESVLLKLPEDNSYRLSVVRLERFDGKIKIFPIASEINDLYVDLHLIGDRISIFAKELDDID